MLQKQYHVDLNALMRLYETNYAKLVRLMPCEKTQGQHRVYDINGTAFQLRIVESTRYTSLLSIESMQQSPCYLKPVFRVRLYHDARVAEVCSIQQKSQIKPRYDYPNSHMYQRDEKYQINAFLSDWLIYCLKHGTACSY